MAVCLLSDRKSKLVVDRRPGESHLALDGKNLRLDLNARGSYCQPGVVCVTLMRFAQLKKVLGVGSKIGPLRRHLDSTC